MARLTDEEKRELLEDSRSEARRADFRRLREQTLHRRLTLDELADFLNWAQEYMTEDVAKRGAISGKRFLI